MIRSACFALVLALTAAAHAQVPLLYRLTPGQQFALVLEARLDLPILGDVDAVVRASTTVARSGNDYRLTQRITRTAHERGTARMDATFLLTPGGNVTLQSALPADAEKAFLAQGALLFMPAMPGVAPAAGHAWQAERTMKLPKIPAISLPPQVRIRTTYRITNVLARAGKTVAAITWTSTEAPLERVKVALNGTWDVDAATGLPISGVVGGKITIPVRLLPDMKLKVEGTVRIEPIATAARAQGAGPRGAPGATSLLGVGRR